MSLSKKGTTTKTLLEKNVLTLYRLIKKLSTISFFSKHDPLFDRPSPYPKKTPPPPNRHRIKTKEVIISNCNDLISISVQPEGV